MTLTNYITFIKAHEKLIIIVLAAFLLYRTGQGVENSFLHRNDKPATTIAVTNDAASNKQLIDQLAQAKSDSAQQTAQLTQDMNQKIAALKQQQVADQQLSQQQILDRWKLLQPIKPDAVQTNGATDTLTPEAAQQTVQALEQIPVLTSEVTDLNQELVSNAVVISDQASLITGLNTQLVDEKKSHVADVNTAKQAAKHSWWHGFKWGVITGAVGTEVIRVGIGRP